MKRPYCYPNLDEVRESHLIPAARMAAIDAEIESRITEPRTPDGHPITTAKLATFPDGKLMLYPRMDHDPEGTFIRRELLAEMLTLEELEMVNKHASGIANARADVKRFEKATKLDRWDGWVTDGESYWDSVEAYLDERGDDIEDGEEEAVPLYLWVAEPQVVVPSLDAADITEHWITDRGWEDCDLDAFDGVKELQAALDAFVALNAGVVAYHMDSTRVVMLDAYLCDKAAMKAADDECNRTGIHPIHQR